MSLELDPDEMRAMGHRVADLVADHLSSLPSQPILTTRNRPEASRAFSETAPEEGRDFDEVLATLQQEVFEWHAREPHPGFMAFVPGCPSYPGIMGDWIAAGFNFFAGVWMVAPGANAMELAVLDWFRQWLGMPAGSSGLLTTGGSAASVTAIAAIRHEVVGDDASRLPKLVVYTSDQSHSAVTRAAWIAGIPRSNVRAIETDSWFSMRVDLLRDAIRRDRESGMIPMVVAASAGTTNTGAVDALDEIADLCASEKLRLHVDAAYAGFAVLTERGRKLLSGLGRADSVALDPHKTLFVPFECGCLLVRDTDLLTNAFRIFPEYLHDVSPGEENVNFADRGEQLTRYARSLKVWMTITYYGTRRIAAALDGCFDLAALAERLVRENPRLEVTSPAQFGILCFRVHPPDEHDEAALEKLNIRANQRINAEGSLFVSSTRLRGRYSLRICVNSFRTTAADVERVIRIAAS
jgi:aromatic-L-amino-acid/L-tryptophan decarboxylase